MTATHLAWSLTSVIQLLLSEPCVFFLIFLFFPLPSPSSFLNGRLSPCFLTSLVIISYWNLIPLFINFSCYTYFNSNYILLCLYIYAHTIEYYISIPLIFSIFEDTSAFPLTVSIFYANLSDFRNIFLSVLFYNLFNYDMIWIPVFDFLIVNEEEIK